MCISTNTRIYTDCTYTEKKTHTIYSTRITVKTGRQKKSIRREKRRDYRGKMEKKVVSSFWKLTFWLSCFCVLLSTVVFALLHMPVRQFSGDGDGNGDVILGEERRGITPAVVVGEKWGVDRYRLRESEKGYVSLGKSVSNAD